MIHTFIQTEATSEFQNQIFYNTGARTSINVHSRGKLCNITLKQDFTMHACLDPILGLDTKQMLNLGVKGKKKPINNRED